MANQRAFGLEKLSHEQHQSFYKVTGIDLDDRKEIIEKWSYASKKRLYLVITLAMSIPGFSQLPLNDQIALIKASRAEAITVMIYNRFDGKNNIFYSTHTNHISSKLELIKVYDDEALVDRMFSTAKVYQQLNLNTTEMLLVLASIILSPDRTELESKVTVEEIHFQVVSALQRSLKANHPNDKKLLGRVLCSLIPLRELTPRSDRALPKIHRDWSPQCELDPFWKEFIEDSHKWHDNHI